MMMRVFTFFSLLVTLLLPAHALQLRDAESHFFDESFGDLQEELETAKEQGKKAILIMFEMDECPFCKRMKAKVLNRDDIQDYFREHFLILTMDVEGDLEITDFQGEATTQKEFALKQYRVRATPVFQFVDLDGKPIKKARYTGATSDADEFMLLGKYVVDEHYKETSFVRYKRQMKQQKKKLKE
jgi:thioredoxin-related protein